MLIAHVSRLRAALYVPTGARAIPHAMAMLMLFFAAACSPLTTFNTLAPKDKASAPAERAIAYGTDARQKLDVYPAGPRDGAAPVVVFIYGGGWNNGRRQDYSFAGRALAAQGYLTIVPDYRLVPQVHFPTFLEDSAAATAWAQANAARLGGDPRQIYLIGHSAGAYNAAMIALDARYLRAAGGDPANISGVIGLAGPYDFLPFDPGAAQNAFGQAPEPAQTQPINFVRADAPPMLLLHGAEDKVVRIRNTTSLGEKLNAIGAKAEVKIYPGADHPDLVLALSKPLRKRAPVLADINAFIAAQTPARP